MTDTLARVAKAQVTAWGWRLLMTVIGLIITALVAQGNAIQAAKDESANRRISGVESAISDLPEIREQVALLNANQERGRVDQEAFQDRIEAKADAIQTAVSQLAAAVSAQNATINMLLRGTPGPPPAGLIAPEVRP